MCSRRSRCQIVKAARRIASSLELNISINNLSDVDVVFFEAILQIITGLVPSGMLVIHPRYSEDRRNVYDRLESCIKEVSEVIQVPLAHIKAAELMHFEKSAVGNFLEIIEFLVDYFCEERIENIHPPWKSVDSMPPGDYEET
ncbi:hypothetical protein FBUS_01468 [Fasciolopsis buskii]|uniref:Uncharacterized protein n=1 Tax=Fasciolopsis buskii TaxID=27845 RepID=A0A8E0RZL5_9TREM|nr:hypothetical protein FBUS_01468 [Fasciolopsis buski]